MDRVWPLSEGAPLELLIELFQISGIKESFAFSLASHLELLLELFQISGIKVLQNLELVVLKYCRTSN